MGKLKEKFKYWLKTVIEFILNPRLLLCCGIAWIITNGWAYIATSLAVWFNLEWLEAIAGAYLAALWIPFTPEKIITVSIAIFLLRLFFPNDQKTLKRLYDMKDAAKAEFKKLRLKRKEKKNNKDTK
ncbi:MAG: hypothetical protein IKU82_01405 [Clostridia bacterium]|nr:hypothetical protein [Clostridia bacterium]